MPTFQYKAVRADGETFDGVVEVADRFGVYAEVRKSGGTVLSIDPVGKGFNLNLEKIWAFARSVKTSDKIVFARNLSAMLGAGLSLSRALAVIERQTRSKKLKEVLVSLSNGIKEGRSLHEGMELFPNVFSSLFSAMVKAGEESGKLSESLAVVAEQTERSYNLTRKIRGALIYPGILITAMVGIGIAMLIFVVPTLVDTFKGFNVPLPLTTRLMIGISDFLIHQAILVGLLVIGLTALVVAGLRTKQGKRLFERVLLMTPVIGTITREINAARTARTLSSLTASGVEIVSAISITGEVVQNSFFREVLHEAEEQIGKGKQIGGVFSAHEDLYPPFVGELIAVGEETGQLSSMLVQVANFYENEVEEKTKNMSTIIEPFLMLLIGAGVGVFALSIISPIYSLTSAI